LVSLFSKIILNNSHFLSFLLGGFQISELTQELVLLFHFFGSILDSLEFRISIEGYTIVDWKLKILHSFGRESFEVDE
jgi:hypothetical protein